jgi:putative addiction module killer protein
MIDIEQSDTFKSWLANLKDRQAKARILMRLDRIALGNFGDIKPVREGIKEIRIDYGQGYRIYFIRQGQITIVLLAGGDKSTQNADIETAIALAKHWSNKND